MNRDNYIYVGTYSSEDMPGILEYRMESGKLEEVQKIRGIANPSYLARSSSGDRMYAVIEDMEFQGRYGGGVAALEKKDGCWDIVKMMGTTGTLPCHLLLDEKRNYLYVANYMSGCITMFALDQEGMLDRMCDVVRHTGRGLNPERQEGPHAHYIGFSPDGKGIWCVDLGMDTIRYYEIDDVNSRLVANTARDIHVRAGMGPRHFVWDIYHQDILYVVCELTSEVLVIREDGKGGMLLQCISSLPDNTKDSTCAAIKQSEDGRFLYVSNRGHDSIAVFAITRNVEAPELTLVEIVDAGGETPRDFLLLDNAMVIANQDSNRICVFERDTVHGRIRNTGRYVECHAPVCVE